MKNLVYLFICLISLTACDDGDVITVEFDFEDTFNACGDIVFYKTIEEPAQSFSLQLTSPTLTIDDLLETEPDPDNSNLVIVTTPEYIYTLNETSNIFNYRTYASIPSSPFCNDIPPADLNVTQNDVSAGGIATIKIELVEDDDDGVLAENEDPNTDNDDDPLTTPLDTDNDGIPNYLDIDDDGDNVLTQTELVVLDPNTDNDDNPLTNPLDTDGDGIPNYLDNDDDGDGVATRDEENFSQDNNPTNDITDNTVGPDYLNTNITIDTTEPATSYRTHAIKQEFKVSIILEDISFPTISEQFIDFGTLTNSATSTSRNGDPIFN